MLIVEGCTLKSHDLEQAGLGVELWGKKEMSNDDPRSPSPLGTGDSGRLSNAEKSYY